MNYENLNFLKNVKISDFTLGIIAVLGLLNPGMINIYMFDKEFISDNNIITVILFSLSLGLMSLIPIYFYLLLGIPSLLKKYGYSIEGAKIILPMAVAVQSSLYVFFLYIIYKIYTSDPVLLSKFYVEGVSKSVIIYLWYIAFITLIVAGSLLLSIFMINSTKRKKS